MGSEEGEDFSGHIIPLFEEDPNDKSQEEMRKRFHNKLAHAAMKRRMLAVDMANYNQKTFYPMLEQFARKKFRMGMIIFAFGTFIMAIGTLVLLFTGSSSLPTGSACSSPDSALLLLRHTT